MNQLASITPTIITKDGRPVTTSLAVADHFEKQHKHVLRDIDNLECSNEFSRSNFGPSNYIDDRGKKQPLTEITKDGFMFLVMGFTGKKAAAVKEAYIEAFNRMEAALRDDLLVSDQVSLEKDEYIALLRRLDEYQTDLIEALQRKLPKKDQQLPRSKRPFTDEDRLQIVRLYRQGLNQSEIAREVKRSKATVWFTLNSYLNRPDPDAEPAA